MVLFWLRIKCLMCKLPSQGIVYYNDGGGSIFLLEEHALTEVRGTPHSMGPCTLLAKSFCFQKNPSEILKKFLRKSCTFFLKEWTAPRVLDPEDRMCSGSWMCSAVARLQSMASGHPRFFSWNFIAHPRKGVAQWDLGVALLFEAFILPQWRLNKELQKKWPKVWNFWWICRLTTVVVSVTVSSLVWIIEIWESL